MCCAEFIVKYVLFFSNLVFSLAGIALVAVGIAVLLNINEVTDVLPGDLSTIPIAVIVVGAVIFLISFMGCCGAIRESCCMLTMFAIVMAILAGVKIWISTLIFKNLNDLDSQTVEWITTAFNNGWEEFQAVEQTFVCCGTTGPGSYSPGVISTTCCSESVCTVSNSYPGCIGVVTDYLQSFGSAIGSVVLIVIIVEIVAVIFGLFLAHTSSNKKKSMNYA